MATKAKTVESVNTAEKNQRYIYLGPNHPKALVVNATIFKGGIPQNVKEILDKYPSAKALLIPVENTAKIMQELRQANTASTILYKKAEQEFKGGI